MIKEKAPVKICHFCVAGYLRKTLCVLAIGEWKMWNQIMMCFLIFKVFAQMTGQPNVPSILFTGTKINHNVPI